MMNSNNAYFCRLFQRAFLFNIPKTVDFISFKITENIIDLFVISKKQLSDQECEYIYSAISEVEGDIVECITFNTHFLIMDNLPKNLEQFGEALFAFIEQA